MKNKRIMSAAMAVMMAGSLGSLRRFRFQHC